MRRLIIIGALLLFCNAMVEAQPRFRTVIFADTNDSNIGNAASKSLNFINTMLGEIAAGIDIPEESMGIYAGGECSKATLMKWLESFGCSNEDIIVFCYLGHGIRSVNDTSIFPQMCLGGHRDSDFVSIEAVKNEVMKKGPRFALFIGDCCNSISPNVTPKFAIMNAADNSYTGEMQAKNLEQLFLNQRGYVITTGSKAGEYSWANNNTTDKEGMVYTTNLTQLLIEYVAATNGTCSWKEFLSTLSSVVGEIPIKSASDGQIYHQHPIYRIYDGKTNPKPNPDPDRNPKPRISIIKEKLMEIADDRNDSYDRISQAQSFNRRSFARDAVVKVVGRDNQTVLSIESAEDYLNRISTARRLRGIVVLDMKEDNQKMITNLTLHEIYYRKNK